MDKTMIQNGIEECLDLLQKLMGRDIKREIRVAVKDDKAVVSYSLAISTPKGTIYVDGEASVYVKE